MKIIDLVTKDLGYCCPWFFFSHYLNSETIADRLGVTPRAVRNHLSAAREGRSACTECPRCMKYRVTAKK